MTRIYTSWKSTFDRTTRSLINLKYSIYKYVYFINLYASFLVRPGINKYMDRACRDHAATGVSSRFNFVWCFFFSNRLNRFSLLLLLLRFSRTYCRVTLGEIRRALSTHCLRSRSGPQRLDCTRVSFDYFPSTTLYHFRHTIYWKLPIHTHTHTHLDISYIVWYPTCV